MEELSQEFGHEIVQIPSIEGIFRLPGEANIAHTNAFRKGAICGIDITSALAVNALELQENDQVLDLCCAPGKRMIQFFTLLHLNLIGAKLVYMANIIGKKCGKYGNITGVDISKHRLSTCRSMIKKYKIPRARVFLEDGTTFSNGAPNLIEQIVSARNLDHISKSQISRKYKPFYSTKILREESLSERLYDKVIVDAECTHDGSVIHLIKSRNNKWKDLKSKFLDMDRLNQLENLQRKLIQNGARWLKPGGIIVYSTCSFSMFQNQCIILWFLANHPDFSLESIPIDGLHVEETLTHAQLPPELVDELSKITSVSRRWMDVTWDEIRQNTLIFNASYVNIGCESLWTSGMFIARLRRK